jgi:hypothetical protein
VDREIDTVDGDDLFVSLVQVADLQRGVHVQNSTMFSVTLASRVQS